MRPVPSDEQFARVDRARVWAACYRITGCAADADEILQEAFARAVETRPAVSFDAPLEPWIFKVATRLSIDRLRRRRATAYPGPWLPSPVDLDAIPVLAAAPDDATRYEQVESATFAFLLALEALTPAQRAVLVLRDVLDLSAAETAAATGESEENVRTLHRRARVKLEAYDRERLRPDAALRARAQSVLEALFGHLVSGDTSAALALLADGVRLVNDGGGEFRTARKVVRGPDHVIRFFTGLLRKVGAPDRLQLRTLNGLPAFELGYDHVEPGYAPRLVVGVLLDGHGRAATLYSVLATRKLVHLDPR